MNKVEAMTSAHGNRSLMKPPGIGSYNLHPPCNVCCIHGVQLVPLALCECVMWPLVSPSWGGTSWTVPADSTRKTVLWKQSWVMFHRILLVNPAVFHYNAIWGGVCWGETPNRPDHLKGTIFPTGDASVVNGSLTMGDSVWNHCQIWC